MSDFEFIGEPIKWLKFPCPNGQKECMIPIKPQKLPNGASWTWDGNREKPTITPSINCGECGWHGFITKGKFE